MRYAPIKPAAYSISEPGACGAHGEIAVVCEDGRLFRLNYLHGNISRDQIKKLFPEAASTGLSHFGINYNPPTGWIPVYLGLGNNLFIRGDMFPSFASEAKARKIIRRGDLYNGWVEIIQQVINGSASGQDVMQKGCQVIEIELGEGPGNFDLIAKNSFIMSEDCFTIMDLLRPL